MGHMCVTQSDTFRYARLRYCSAFFGDGDGGRGRGAIAAWILQHQTASTRKRNTCYARLTCTRIYDARPQSAHWREAKMRIRIPSKNVTPKLGSARFW